jgi:hypothetical protein
MTNAKHTPGAACTAYVTEGAFLLCAPCYETSAPRVKANAEPRPLQNPDECDRCGENIPVFASRAALRGEEE